MCEVAADVMSAFLSCGVVRFCFDFGFFLCFCFCVVLDLRTGRCCESSCLVLCGRLGVLFLRVVFLVVGSFAVVGN